MRIAEKIDSATRAANEWRCGRAWNVLKLDLMALGFYGIVRGQTPGKVTAWLDNVRWDL